MMLVQNSALIVLFFFLLFNPLRALGALTTGFLEAEITLFALGDIFLDVLGKKYSQEDSGIIHKDSESNRK